MTLFRKIFSALLCFLLSAWALYAAPRGKQELVPAGSWVYDALTAIALEEGRADFSDNAPLSINEILLYLSEADYSSLSSSGKSLYDRIKVYAAEDPLSFEAGIFSLEADPVVNLEGMYKSEDDIDWVYGKKDRLALISFPVKFQAKDLFTMYTELDLRQNYGYALSDATFTNIPLEASQFDTNFPHRAYFSTGYSFTDTAGMNFQIGLGERSVGRSLGGSVIMSEYLTTTSFASLSFYSPDVRYCMNVNQFNVDRYLYMHQLEMRLFKKLTFSAIEAIFVNAPLELRFLNPWTIYHGMSPWRDYEPDKDDSEGHTCAYMCFKLQYVPVKNLRLYANFAQDQFQTKYEMDNWPDNVTPNGICAQLGIESYVPFRGGRFHAWLEGYYADPYLYIKESPNWSLVGTFSENMGEQAVFYEWIGSPYGPDTAAAQLSFGYEHDNWSITAGYLFKACGEYSGTKVFKGKNDCDWGGQDRVPDLDKWVYPDTSKDGFEEAKRKQSLVTPSGIPEYVNRISLCAKWSPVSAVTLAVRPACVFIFNSGNVSDNFKCGLETAVSVTFRPVRMFQ